MKELVKVIICIGAFFTLMMLVFNLTGWLTLERLEDALTWAKDQSGWAVGALVAFFLFLDLFVAVPTMSLGLLSGNFLGMGGGVLAFCVGCYAAGTTGFWISRRWGEKVLQRVLRDEGKREEMKACFERNGFMMIVLSRALPEVRVVTACLAGVTGMKFSKFIVAWTLATLPYALVVVYAGSISSLDKPTPAVVTAVLVTGTLWGAWSLFSRKNNTSQTEASPS